MSLSRVAFLSLKRRRLRALLLIVSVMISTSILTGVNAGVDGLQRTYSDMVSTNLGYTDLIIQSNTTNRMLTVGSIASSLKDQSIASYSPRIQYATPFTSSNGNFTVTNWAFVVGGEPELDEEFGEYVMIHGSSKSMAEALRDQSSSCVVNEYYAKRMNLKIGDDLYVGSYNIGEPLPAAPEKVFKLTVSGIIRDYGRAYWFDSKHPESFAKINGELFLSLATAQNLCDVSSDSVTQVYVHLKDLTEADAAKSRLEESLGSDYSIANLKVSMLYSVEQSFASYRGIAAVISGMSLMIAIMLLLNSMFAAVSERKYEVGIMRSMGASRTQIFFVFIVEVLLIAVVGALASIPLSVLISRMVTSIMPAPYIQNVGQASSSIEFVFSFNTVFLSVLTGITASSIIGLVPSATAARADIVQVLRPHMRVRAAGKKWRVLMLVAGFMVVIAGLGLIQTSFARATTWVPTEVALVGYALAVAGAILLSGFALPALSRAFSSILTPIIDGVRVVVHRNVLRNFRRSVFAYGAFAISIALMISLSSLVTTASSYDLGVTKYVSGADIQVVVSAPASFAEEIRSIDGVKNVAAAAYVYQSNMSFNGQYAKAGNIRLVGVNSTEFFETIYKTHLAATLDGMATEQVYSALTTDPGNIILQESLARSLAANIGDTITCTFKNQTQMTEKAFRIIATVDLLAGSWETLYKSASTAGYYVAIARFDDFAPYREATTGGSNMDEFYISLTPDANTTLVVDALDQKCRLYGYNPWIGTTADTVQKVQNSYNQAEILALSITTFSIVVSALGIVAAMAYTTLERRREIGLLMTLGLDRRQNTTVIVGETVLLCLLGITVGASTGIGLSYFVVQSISWWSSIPQPALALSPYTLPVAAATIILAALTTSVYLANRMSKLNLVDALRR